MRGRSNRIGRHLRLGGRVARLTSRPANFSGARHRRMRRQRRARRMALGRVLVAPSPDPCVARVLFRRNGQIMKQPDLTNQGEQYLSNEEWRAWQRDGNEILKPASHVRPWWLKCFWLLWVLGVALFVARLVQGHSPESSLTLMFILAGVGVPIAVGEALKGSGGGWGGWGNFNPVVRTELWSSFEAYTRGLYEPRGISLYMDARLPYMDIRFPGATVDVQMAAATAFIRGAERFPVPFVPETLPQASYTAPQNPDGGQSLYPGLGAEAVEAPPSYSAAVTSSPAADGGSPTAPLLEADDKDAEGK